MLFSSPLALNQLLVHSLKHAHRFYNLKKWNGSSLSEVVWHGKNNKYGGLQSRFFQEPANQPWVPETEFKFSMPGMLKWGFIISTIYHYDNSIQSYPTQYHVLRSLLSIVYIISFNWHSDLKWVTKHWS